MDGYGNRVLYARHLEVFVPKPGNRNKEIKFFQCLDGLLSQPTIVAEKVSPDIISLCQDGHRSLLERRVGGWENILYGYSTYLTDGTFMQLMPERRARTAATVWREQTLVLKFIVTNYATTLSETSRNLLLGELAFSSMTPMERSELVMADLHYRAMCAHVVKGIGHKALVGDGKHEGEAEIWSQEWPTVLDRWKRDDKLDPIILDVKDRDLRLDRNEHTNVISVIDYAAGLQKTVPTSVGDIGG
jgi:hypothetical protein